MEPLVLLLTANLLIKFSNGWGILFLTKQEEEESKSLKFNFVDASVSKIISKYPHWNLFKQITTKEIQVEINELKSQARTLETNLFKVKMNTLELKAKLSLLENNEPSSSHKIIETDNIEISKEKLSIISSYKLFPKLLLKNDTALSILMLKISLLKECPSWQCCRP